VERGEFEEAARVRQQLVEEELAIPAHPAYLNVVRHLLQTWTADDTTLAAEIEQWLELYPDAQYFHHHPFRAEFSIISSKKSKEVLFAFGHVCAAKGYHWLVANKVIPALSSLRDTEDLCSELQELVQNSQDSTTHAEQLKAAKAKRGM
jgi:hypothetical protein